MSEPRTTVRVKIGVAVDQLGNWSGFGYKKMEPDGIYEAADTLSTICRYFWLEADLPLPEVTTVIAATVTEQPNEE
jgi:hypothetical protein